MPRRNRVDPWGDLHAVAARGMFTGNRGCVVDDRETVVRHHGSTLWISCKTEFKGWRWPLARPKRWTPLFFLDDAVALAAGHRPCGLCRRQDYQAYKRGVGCSLGVEEPLKSTDLNRLLQRERLAPGRGLVRAKDRILWRARIKDLPDGTVVVEEHAAYLLYRSSVFQFSFDGWVKFSRAPNANDVVQVLTPPTSVSALRFGYKPQLHCSADGS